MQASRKIDGKSFGRLENANVPKNSKKFLGRLENASVPENFWKLLRRLENAGVPENLFDVWKCKRPPNSGKNRWPFRQRKRSGEKKCKIP